MNTARLTGEPHIKPGRPPKLNSEQRRPDAILFLRNVTIV